MTLDPRPETARLSPRARSVVLVCLAVTVIDGLDLLVFSMVLPSLLGEGAWGLTQEGAGVIGSMSLVGMTIGALLAGSVADNIGRRPVILICAASFSIFTALGAVAPSAFLFGAFRIIAGIGFGGALPTVVAIVQEFVPRSKRQLYSGVVHIGFPLGGVLAALVSLAIIPAFGWRAMFLVSGLVGVVIFVLAFRFLPESVLFLLSKGRTEDAARVANDYQLELPDASAPASGERGGTLRSLKVLWSPGFRAATLLFPVISFLGLGIAYGLNTWMPQILAASGFTLTSTLLYTAAYNVGNAFGMVLISGLADRLGPRRVIASGFLLLGLFVAVLSFPLSAALTFACVLGIGVLLASQTAVAGFNGVYYTDESRATALGLTLGVGRIGGIFGPTITGLLVASSFGTSGTFRIFAIGVALAAVLIMALPRTGMCDVPRREGAQARTEPVT